MEKQEVLERLCKLSYEVMEKRFRFEIPGDCFCTKREYPHYGYQYDEQIIEYIENAVREKIEREE